MKSFGTGAVREEYILCTVPRCDDLADCIGSSADAQGNSIETIGSYKYGICSINESDVGSETYPIGQSTGIPRIGDIRNDNSKSKVQ